MSAKNKTTTTIRWIARISGSVILAFILFFLLGHIFGEDQAGEGFRNTRELIIFICFPISTIIGLILALKWEGLGGLITVTGYAGLLFLRTDLLTEWLIIIPIIPGILYLVYWFLTKRKTP